MRYLLCILILLSALTCSGGDALAPLPTGVWVKDTFDGGLEIAAVAKASKLSIEKEIPAMMQSTSRDAAILLVKAELKKPRYKNLSKNYRTMTIEYLRLGEYCRLVGYYHPSGIPVTANRPEVVAGVTSRFAEVRSAELIELDQILQNTK